MFKKTTDQETKETLYSKETVKDYQEQITQTYRNVVNKYLESQKQILDSLQVSWSLIIYNIYGKVGFWNYYWWWINPLKMMLEAYGRIIDNSFAEG
ncbi:MAG TPA: hypothetical protein VKA98_08200 [Nitrososphaeraceae archaeon]|nr:hypothetical protein [Nitrososphaeraceae archaeon]